MARNRVTQRRRPQGVRDANAREGAQTNRLQQSHTRAVNAYLKWTGSTLRVPRMKEPQFILPTFNMPQVQRLIGWKPRSFYERRLHLLVLMLLDTGCRISEALSLRVEDCDLDNLLLVLNGKGMRCYPVPVAACPWLSISSTKGMRCYPVPVAACPWLSISSTLRTSSEGRNGFSRMFSPYSRNSGN